MNVQRFRKICKFLNTYHYRSAHKFSKAESEIELLTKQETRLGQSTSGIKVASIENYSPISRVSVAVKAGTRHESAHNSGIVHHLRNCAVLGTKNHSAFALTRNLELHGAKLDVTATREHIIYTLECIRDDIESGLQILAEVTNNQAFKDWEVKDASSKINVDLALHSSSCEAVLLEALHSAAFKGGLSNSLYCPSFMIGKHDSEMLKTFVKEHFTASRTSVVGLGIPHEDLQSSIDKLFVMEDHVLCKDGPSKFASREVRVEENTTFSHAAIVGEGASLSNQKEALTSGLLQCILGLGHNLNTSCKFSKLGEAAAKLTQNPFFVSALNINYSDSGLFGVYVAANPDEMNQIVKAVVTQMRSAVKSISEKDIDAAKRKLKTKLLFERESSRDFLSALAYDVSEYGQIRKMTDISKSIDEIKASDVASFASKVLKVKPAMAAVGRLHSTPHVDELA